MVPRTNKPILANLDPEIFAADLVGSMASMLNLLNASLGQPPLQRLVPATTPLYGMARELACFARDGTPFEDIEGAVRGLHLVLHRSMANLEPWMGSGREDPGDLEPTPEGWGHLVLLAARGRLALQARRPLLAGELAALTNTSADHIRNRIRAGELKVEKTSRERPKVAVRHRDACVWAEARGVRVQPRA